MHEATKSKLIIEQALPTRRSHAAGVASKAAITHDFMCQRRALRCWYGRTIELQREHSVNLRGMKHYIGRMQRKGFCSWRGIMPHGLGGVPFAWGGVHDGDSVNDGGRIRIDRSGTATGLHVDDSAALNDITPGLVLEMLLPRGRGRL